MVCHIIGRKHRLKYIEENRRDLVTWDGLTVRNQGGKVMRAKAEIIERQDGRGTPKAMVRRGPEGKLNISRVSRRQKQKRDQSISQRPIQDVPPLFPELKDYNRRKAAAGFSNMPALYPDEPNMNRNRDSFSHDRVQEEQQRTDYREGLKYREDYMNPDYHSSYENEYVDDPQSGVLEPRDVPSYDYRKQMPHHQAQDLDYYPEEASSYKRPYPERDALEEFYAEEVRRGQLRSHEYQPSQKMYLEGDKQPWSLERESNRHDSANRAHGLGSMEPEAKRRNISTPLESDRSHGNFFDVVKDYHHERSKPYEEETFGLPGPSRAGSSISQRRSEVSSTISNIPEPFQRFLKGGPNNEGSSKRKSRFSDASPEELEMTKEIFRDEYGPSYPVTGGGPRQAGAPLRPEINVTQYSDPYGELQSQHQPEDFHRGSSESQGVFDMLRNVEIENAEEAEFLKSKLFSLLKEFKTKKLEKTGLDSQSRAGISKNYGDLKLDSQLPRQHRYERSLREDSDHRRPQALDFGSGHRQGQKRNEHIFGEQYKEYHHPTYGEPSHSNRSHYEDEPPCFPELFEDPMCPRVYQPAAEEFYEPRSSAPSLHMEQMGRIQRDPRYSNNLDKITSALLELVARK
ncbi:uncharacterized protein si:ch211-13c6.2 isoform X2 [Melanotaenia boesemani]|nr:uncharacterized protein si:ch211-13c6.2 isoform X2 [Melanotaenia boesemani]